MDFILMAMRSIKHIKQQTVLIRFTFYKELSSRIIRTIRDVKENRTIQVRGHTPIYP